MADWLLPRPRRHLLHCRTTQITGARSPMPIWLSSIIEDPGFVSILESRKPKHIIIGIGGGIQDKLGNYLKRRLKYRPAIYCIGAAPGFVTGDQVVIPMWADRLFFRLDFPPDHATAHVAAEILERATAACNDVAIPARTPWPPASG
jgi:Glycosyl transferase WecG/TagA/CpsF family